MALINFINAKAIKGVGDADDGESDDELTTSTTIPTSRPWDVAKTTRFEFLAPRAAASVATPKSAPSGVFPPRRIQLPPVSLPWRHQTERGNTNVLSSSMASQSSTTKRTEIDQKKVPAKRDKPEDTDDDDTLVKNVDDLDVMGVQKTTTQSRSIKVQQNALGQ